MSELHKTKSYILPFYKLSDALHTLTLTNGVEVGLPDREFKLVFDEFRALERKDPTDYKLFKEVKFNCPGGLMIIYNKDFNET